MKIISWNVNGLRSVIGKGLCDFIKKGNFDIVMLQEVKTDTVPVSLLDLGYEAYMIPSHKKGYSGTLTLTRKAPLSVKYGIEDDGFDSESRVVTIETDWFYAVNVYFPNSRRDLSRLDFKMKFDGEFEKFVQNLRRKKPVLIGGDFNVAHTELDIARPKDNENNAGFTAQERRWMDRFLEMGYLDTYRMFVREGGHYTWWTYRANARERNIGWRIDYLVASEEMRDGVKDAGILGNVKGSDHAPIYVDILV
jgi:exodeoxyribonuclease-3